MKAVFIAAGLSSRISEKADQALADHRHGQNAYAELLQLVGR